MTRRNLESTKRLYNAIIRKQINKLEIATIKLLKECPEFINEVPRQTPEFIKAALEVDGSAIIYLREEPSAEYRDIAIRSDPEAIGLIDHPTADEQSIAVSSNPNAILYINNPDKILIRAALCRNPLLIGFFNNLDPKTKIISYTAYFKNLKENDLSTSEIKKELEVFARAIDLKLNKSHYEYIF